MRRSRHNVPLQWGWVLGSWLLGVCCAWSAQPKAAAAKATTNAPVAVLEIPQSVFVRDNTKGIDPFFPTKGPATTNSPPVALEFKLRGIIGPPLRRIALINNQSFQVGESNSVSVGNRKQLVRCVAIQDQAVMIEVGPERQRKTLFLNVD
jgi:hypothetical protein